MPAGCICSAANQSGASSVNVVFTFDANSGVTRTGTLTVAGQTLTITQAGSTYAATTNVTTLVSSGLSGPEGIAVDSVGNVYIVDRGNSVVKEWSATSNTVTTLFSLLVAAEAVAVDGAGNVYIGSSAGYVEKWIAASNTFIALVSGGLSSPEGIALDGAGNVYVADNGHNAIKKWIAVSNTVTTLVASGVNRPWGVAVDGAGNVYISDEMNNAVKELTHAFVDSSAKTESAGAGSDALPVVLPATANLTGPFAPASDSAWLTIAGVTNGVVNFAFSANTSGTNRTALITVLGQTIAVTQAAVMPPLLTGFTVLSNNAFQFSFTNSPGLSFTIWASTNLLLPLTNWTPLGSIT